jgi:hypothetical protein
VAEVFPYSRFSSRPDTPPAKAFPRGHDNHLPLADLKLRFGRATSPLLKVLVDTGSAYCVFGLDTAGILGINVRSGNLRKGICGIGGASVDLYFFTIELVMNTIVVDCYAGFLDHNYPGNHIWVGLLGEYDFLTKMPVNFDAPALRFTIG